MTQWEVLYNMLTEFGIPMKLDRLTEMCLNETYSKVHIDKICLMLFKFALEYTITRSKKTRKDWNWMEHIGSWSILMMIIYWVKT
jgi:hypothetical protein